ncbi:MAG: adenylate/guanylate cyclase domain-containing protein [Hyphomonadaceae bacterium]
MPPHPSGEGRLMQTPKTRYAKSGDVSIAYQAFGEGPRTIVMAPAWVTHVDLAWEEPAQARFLEGLGRFARVILFDKRGTGASDRHFGCPCLQDRMDDIRAVMDANQTERAAIFGCCDGGTMSSMFAAAHPERVSHLVLFGLFAKRLHAPDYPWAPTAEARERYFEFLANSWGEGLDFFGMAPSRKGDAAFLEWCGKLERIGASPGAAVALARLNTEIDIREILPAISAPTLILRRRDDAEVRHEEAQYVAERIPGAKFVTLDGADHLHWTGNSEDVLSEVQEFITGARAERAAQSALITILCTDIVGSTQRAAELGDARWRSLLQRHDDIVASELRRFMGRPINSTGDGVLAAFDSPARSARAGIAIQQAVKSLDLDVRAGVHTGECELRGGAPSGIALHIGARVAALAEAGEVLASRTVRDLAVGSGLSFFDRGEHHLKGVPGEWRVYAVKDAA